MVRDDRLRTRVSAQLKIPEDVQQEDARFSRERRPRTTATLLDDGHVQAGQTGGEELRSVGARTILIRVPIIDGRNSVSRPVALPRTLVLQIRQKASSENG